MACPGQYRDYFTFTFTDILTYPMQQSPSWEANRFFSQSKNSPHFMEPEGSSPHSQVPVLCKRSVTGWIFYGEEFLAPRPTHQAGGPPLVRCPRLLIQYIRSYPSYRRPFLHPQPEDSPCRGDRDPLIVVFMDMPSAIVACHSKQ